MIDHSITCAACGSPVDEDGRCRTCGRKESSPSRAVVACDESGGGAVLWYVGADLVVEIEEHGLRQLCDLGLDDAPRGITVWEGRYVCTGRGGSEDCDAGTQPEGTFRPPTSEEWAAIMQGRTPWR